MAGGEWYSPPRRTKKDCLHQRDKMLGNCNTGEEINNIKPYGQIIVLGYSEYLVSDSSWTPKGKPNKTLVLKPRVRSLDRFKIGCSVDHHTVPTTRQARFILNGKNR